MSQKIQEKEPVKVSLVSKFKKELPQTRQNKKEKRRETKGCLYIG